MSNDFFCIFLQNNIYQCTNEHIGIYKIDRYMVRLHSVFKLQLAIAKGHNHRLLVVHLACNDSLAKLVEYEAL